MCICTSHKRRQEEGVVGRRNLEPLRGPRGAQRELWVVLHSKWPVRVRGVHRFGCRIHGSGCRVAWGAGTQGRPAFPVACAREKGEG